jgi:adenosine kinase
MAERRINAVLLTRGAEGATLYRDGAREDFPPETVVTARDTTGAGDLLLASLLGGLHGGAPWSDAVRGAMRAVETRLRKGDL